MKNTGKKYLLVVLPILLFPNIGMEDTRSFSGWNDQGNIDQIHLDLLNLLTKVDKFWIYEAGGKYPISFDFIKAKSQLTEFEIDQLSLLVENLQKIVFTISKQENYLLNSYDYGVWNAFFEKVQGGDENNNGAQLELSTSCQWWDINCVCDGGYNDPHPRPPWIYRHGGYSTKAEVGDHLINGHGYHETAYYASYSYGVDYTKVVSAYGCNWGPFRSQAFVSRDSNGVTWGYSTQSPEPNPEILGYIWPAPWWGPYVQWWHENN